MKRKWKYLIGIVVGLLAIGIGVGLFLAVKNNDQSAQNAYDRVLMSEDGDTLYIFGADNNIYFDVKTTDGNKPVLDVTQIDGGAHETQIKENEGIYRVTSKEGYLDGTQYLIELGAGTEFCDSALENCKRVIFSIKRPEVTKYEFAENVVTVDESISEIDEGTISLGGVTVEENQILITKDQNGEDRAYKIVNVNGDIATVVEPTLDEVFNELNIYGDFTVDDLSYITGNPEIEMQIVESVRNSSFFDNLVLKAYAADDFKDGNISAKIEYDEETKEIVAKIEIELGPGKKGLFGISGLKNQSVILTFTSRYKIDFHVEMQNVQDWTILATLGNSTDISVNISTKILDESDLSDSDSNDLIHYFYKENNKTYKELMNALKNMPMEEVDQDIDLFFVKIPIAGVPMVFSRIDFKVSPSFKAMVDLTAGVGFDSTITMGVMCNSGGVKPIWNFSLKNHPVNVSVKGKLEAEIGVKVPLTFGVVDERICAVALCPEAGGYFECYAGVALGDISNFDTLTGYGYFEAGRYIKLAVNCKINLVVMKINEEWVLVEIKDTMIKGGNPEIAVDFGAVEDEILLEGTTATLPEFYIEVFNSEINNSEADATQRRTVPLDDLIFEIDGNPIEKKDGKLINLNEEYAGKTVKAYYWYGNNMTKFECELKLTNANKSVDKSAFPDEIFRNYVFTNFDLDKDGVLSKDEIDAVTEIIVDDYYGLGISDLTGIDKFGNLTILNCVNNQLSSLDVSGCTALKELCCGSNQLSSLDVSGCTALEELWCSPNQLSSLDVSNNTALKRLDCDNNQLSSLDVSNNTALKGLECSNNQLSSLDVSKNTSLEWLYCGYNQLSSLDVSKNTVLVSFSCHNNQLSSLNVSKNTSLEWLYCDNNQLSSLDVSKNTSLEWLGCSNNQLSSLDVSKNTSLEWLYCDNNQLSSLDVSHNPNLSEKNIQADKGVKIIK